MSINYLIKQHSMARVQSALFILVTQAMKEQHNVKCVNFELPSVAIEEKVNNDKSYLFLGIVWLITQ